MNKELQKKKDTHVSTDVIDMSQDASKGLEGADKETYAIPFIAVLQGQSPQLDTVKEARSGMFINTITNELFDEIMVIPCAYQRRFLAWMPRELGGGFKGTFLPTQVEGVMEKDEKGLYKRDDGSILKDTRIHYVLVMSDNGSWHPAVMSLSSTQIKKSKQWMSIIQGLELRDNQDNPFNPPSFSHAYRIGTVKEQNDKGSWHGITVTIDGIITNATLYNKAKVFCEEAQSDLVEVQQDAPF